MDIFQEILKSLEHEEHIMLATIISTTGSTPAAELSKMVVRNHGLTAVGTVGGGCMEAEVLTWMRSLYDKKEAKIVTFHLNEDNVESGLICGGSLDVLIESLDRSFLPVLDEQMETRSRGRDSALVTVLQECKSIAKCFVDDNDGIVSLPTHLNLKSRILESAREVIKTHQVDRFRVEDYEIVVEPNAGQPSLIIFGGGHVSKFVSRFAAQVGFRVTVVDDRVAFANKERFPEAAEIVCEDFLKAIDRLSITPKTYVAIITRGHKFDEVVLERIIRSEAKYMGVIGSKRKVLTAYKHYLQKGIPRELIERIHGPIGLDIGAITAEEIGISIVSELISVRRGGRSAVPTKSLDMPKLLSSLEEKSAKGEP